jgi:hypothetical protein
MELTKLCALIIQVDDKQNYKKIVFDIQILATSSMHDIQITIVIKKPKNQSGTKALPCPLTILNVD